MGKKKWPIVNTEKTRKKMMLLNMFIQDDSGE